MLHCLFNTFCFCYIILQFFIPLVYTDKRQLHLVPTSRKFDEPKNRIIVDLPDYHKQSYVNGNFDFVDRDHGDVKLELTDHGVLIPGLNFFTNGEKKASFTDGSDKESDKYSNAEKSYREFQENQRRITELENSLLKKEDIDRNSDGQRKAQEIDLKSEALAKIEELAKQNLEDIAKLKMDALKERQKISLANDKNEAAESISSKEKSNEKDSNDTSVTVTDNNSISNLAESLHIKHDSDKHDNSSGRSETEKNDSDSTNTSGNAPKPVNVHTSSAEALNNIDYPSLSESKGTKERSSASIVATPSGTKEVKASGGEPKADTAKDKKPLIDAKSDDKIEAKIDGNTVAKIEGKTESRIEGKSEDKIEAKTEGKTEDKVESKTEARIEGKTEPRIEGKTEARIEGKTEARIEGKTEARIEGKTEPRIEGKTEPRIEGKTEPRIEGKTESRIEGKGEEKIEAKTESKPDIESKAAVEIKGADEANEKPIEPKLDEEKKKKKIKILILDDDEALPLSSSSLSGHVPEPVPFQYQASVQPQSKPSIGSDQQSSPSTSNHPLVHVLPPNQLHMDQQMGFERPRYDGFDKQDQSLNMHNPEFASHFNPCSSQVGYQQHVFDNGASSHMFNCHETTRQLNENNNEDQFNVGMMRQNLYNNNNNNINNNNPLTNQRSDSNLRPEIHYHFHISKDNLKDLKPINSFNQAPFVKDQLGGVVSTEDKPNEDLNKQQVPELSQYLPMFRQVGDDITNNFRKQYNSNQLPDRMHYSNNDIQRNDNNPQNSYQRFLTKRTFKKIGRSTHKKNISRFLKHKKIKKHLKHSHIKILKTLKKKRLNSK